MESQYPQYGTGTPMGSAAPPPGPAIDAVKLPAIFLAVTGGLGILFALYGIVSNLLGMDEAQLAKALEDPNVPEAAKQWMQMLADFGWVSSAIGLVGSAFVLFGALKMLKLQNFGLSLAGSIVAMIPCISPCCCIGLPVGIWAIVVLSKPEVKSAFTS